VSQTLAAQVYDIPIFPNTCEVRNELLSNFYLTHFNLKEKYLSYVCNISYLVYTRVKWSEIGIFLFVFVKTKQFEFVLKQTS